MKMFGLWRAGERKADVVVLTSGKCVVSWPTSVIVYDSESAARAVHIVHMGGRGEPTEFREEGDDDALRIMRRMSVSWYQDECENVHVDMPAGKRDLVLVGPIDAAEVREYVRRRTVR